MRATRHRIGLLFSTAGAYGAASAEMLKGAQLGIDHVNAGGGAVRLQAVVGDPQGQLARYTALGAALLDDGVRHIVGCYTSQSRKEVIPLIEKRDALLWYTAHYEGFEASPNVVYTGASPNQHAIPLIDFAMRHFALRACCVGSNYVWAWESNRVLREALLPRGGRILSERYVPLGDPDFAQIVAEILRLRPAFVFSTLVGESIPHFLRALRRACREAGIDQAREMPVLSCNLPELAIAAAGPEYGDGHISSNVYFSTVDSAASRAFVAEYRRRFTENPTADAEAAYLTIHLIAQALAAAGSDAVEAVREAVKHQRLQAPQGEVWIDPDTLHAALTPRIGRSRADGTYEILWQAPRPVAPDPYLVRLPATHALPRARLKVV
ncbi:transporter substrate-binding domain-containing protein [Pseudoroseomonas cervicalis]|uniref:transporter substrate-binding domain-containing protein n=1 Tax=Teichococcus cervicalis TaxID=204525 RepID=UPI00277D201F|nr:transporter substrate-binding domain-containing protein [Pseudoroseomonas cervicalis]MDQ1081667.1 urea transport system substrate-binding protein [Pseudoroseomonas cervicalis]